MQQAASSHRFVVVGIGGRTVLCALCRLVISFDDSKAAVIPDVLASHWYDDHGIEGWRDAAADARYRLAQDGWELLDRMRSMA